MTLRFAILALSFLSTSLAAAEHKALPPHEAAASWKLPPGFSATLFAGEPDLVQPMSFTFDDRGRVWVVECLTYPTWQTTGGTGSDRVTIFEDTDGDGRHDKRTVFLDNGLNISSVEVGFGGVWLTAVPNLLFVPDKNGDDVPDGPPQIMLDGFDLKARHNVVGNLAWGPDGWLYGCNGILSNSKIGKPGTPDEKRVAINCGVWRYHPVRHEVEAYAHGTTNPWGLDWDERGQLFITNCVIKHLFHVMPGAHMERMFGQDLNPHVYGLIQSCADHQHWAGGHWTSSRGGHGAHGDAGGGHAHSGCMIYLGDNWPDEYRGNVFLINIHGQRLNRDKLVPTGSSYVAQHEPDFAFCKDPWFRGIHLKYGPDGGVYVSDWSDHGECHDHHSEEECDRTGGRIFKIVYGGGQSGAGSAGKPAVGNALRGVPGGDLAKLTDDDLVNLHSHKNEWLVRHARRILQERAVDGKLRAKALQILRSSLRMSRDLPKENWPFRLRSLWTLHATGQLDEITLSKALDDSAPEIRAQAITIAVESQKPTDVVRNTLAVLARDDAAAQVRLHIAAALQRIPLEQRWPIAEGLVAHGKDADDPQLPLIIWYGVEPLVDTIQTEQAAKLISQTKQPLVRQFLARRVHIQSTRSGAVSDPYSAMGYVELLRILKENSDSEVQADVLDGILATIRGRREYGDPKLWNPVLAGLSATKNERLIDLVFEMRVMLASQNELARLSQEILNQELSVAHRRKLLSLLTVKRSLALLMPLVKLLDDEHLRADAIRALAAFDAKEISPKLVTMYASLPPTEKQDVIQTLTARPAFALALLDAIDQGIIDRKDVSALVIRQLQSLEDKAVNERLAKVWGEIRPASAEKKERIAKLKSQLAPEVVQQADRSRGRALYAKSCATCHKLFDEGGKLAPELTGSQRANLDYVLENVLDPSALVPRDYRVQVLRLADGRIVQGVVKEETPHTLTVETANETIRVPVGEIEARKESPLSMMPEGLFDRLTAEELRDLVGYLASPQQVPLPTP